jgi:SAM-dependent methyltransferase
MDYSYFDESYYQDGSKRGTAYVNYREDARNSQTFRELASAIQEVFQPRRVLDVGCATGTTVRLLNEMGCEAYGVDVSEWAVRNAEHSNVRLASADQLPFPDDFFDLVFSCHAMEHIPDAVCQGSLSEISRVNSAFQFHLLPMIGVPPYDGEPEATRQMLRKDPTHQQLHSKAWWTGQFESRGYTQVDTSILIENENSNAELSIGQFLLKKDGSVDSSVVSRRAAARDQRVFRRVQLTRMAQAKAFLYPEAVGGLSYTNSLWKDVERQQGESQTLDLTGHTLHLVIIVEGNACNLRFAAGQDVDGELYAHVGEFQVSVKSGCNVFSFSTEQLRTLRGTPDYAKINHLALGGENHDARITFYFATESGEPILK